MNGLRSALATCRENATSTDSDSTRRPARRESRAGAAPGGCDVARARPGGGGGAGPRQQDELGVAARPQVVDHGPAAFLLPPLPERGDDLDVLPPGLLPDGVPLGPLDPPLVDQRRLELVVHDPREIEVLLDLMPEDRVPRSLRHQAMEPGVEFLEDLGEFGGV